MGRAPRTTRLGNYGAQQRKIRQSESELIERIKKLENMVEKLGDLINVVPGSKSSISNFEHAAFEMQPCLPVDISAPFSGQNAGTENLEGGAFASDQDGPAQARDLHTKFARLVLHEQSGGKRYVSDGFWAKLDDEVCLYLLWHGCC